MVLILTVLGAAAALAWDAMRDDGARSAGHEVLSPLADDGQDRGGPVSGSSAAVVQGVGLGGMSTHGHEAGSPRIPMASDGKDGQRILKIRVIDQRTHMPVADAEVLYQIHEEYDHDAIQTEDPRLLADPERLLGRFGRRVTTSERGIALVPTQLSWLNVVAVHRDAAGRRRYGQRFFDVGRVVTDALDVEIEPDQTLRVRVVQDDDNRPLPDIPVALAVRTGGDEGAAGAVLLLPGGRSADNDGQLAVPHFQLWVRDQRRMHGPFTSARVVADLPGLVGHGPALPIGEPPGSVVELRLPPTGSLSVAVIDPAGRPVTGSTVGVSIVNHGGKPDGGKPALRLVDGAGVARYTRVPLHRRWQVSVNAGSKPVVRTVVGPARAAEHVEVRVAIPIESVIVMGRAVAEDGAPFARARLRVTVAGDGRSRAIETVETDAAGRFLSAFDARLGDRSVRAIFFEDVSQPWRRDGAMACLRHVKSLRVGAQSVGEVVLRKAPIVVRVRLTTHDGDPADAALFVQRAEVPTDAHSKARAAVQGNPPGHWEFIQPAPQIIRIEAGLYECRGHLQPARLRLLVRSSDYLPVEPVEFGFGEQELTIRLDRGGRAEVTVLSDVEIPPGTLRMELAPDPHGDAPWRRQPSIQHATTEGQTRFEWKRIEAGRYRLEARIWGQDRPLAMVPDIRIERSRKSEHERLGAIDLRGKLRLVTISAQGEGVIFVLGQDGQRRDEAYELKRGVGRVLTTTALDLLVAATGYCAQRLRGVARDTTLRLAKRRGVQLQVQASLPIPVPPPGAKLFLAVRSTDQTPQEPGRYLLPWGGAGSVETLLPRASDVRFELPTGGKQLQLAGEGRYDVRLELHRGEVVREIDGVQPRSIIARDGSIIGLRLDASRVKATWDRQR